MEKIDFSFRKKTKRWLGLLTFCLMLCMGQMGFAQYCSPSSEDADYEWITNVTFAGINNTTGGSTGLNNYTSQIATVDKDLIGQEYTLSVSINADFNEYVYVFIDWNQNGILNDSGEVYVLASGTSANGPFTTQVTVPAEAVLGSTRMRVYVNYGVAPTPCANPSYGEIEDYTVTVLGTPPSCPAPTGLTLQSSAPFTSANASWTGSAEEYEYAVTTSATAPESGTSTSEASASGVSVTAGGTYYLHVRSVCGENFSAWSTSSGVFMGLVYCTSIPTSNDGSGITNVVVGTANFPVTDVTYYNYTDTVADITAGIENTSSVTFATGYSYYTNIWIDFNDDGDFTDTGELVYQGESTNANPTTLNTTFNIPPDAIGQHKMRIGTADGGQSTPNPCYSGSYGVTIDLMVNILPPPSCMPPSALTAANLTFNSADLSWTSDGEQFDIKWGTPGFDVETEGTLVEGFANGGTLSGLDSNTTYQFYVRQICGAEESAWAGPFSFYTGYCVPTGTSSSYRITGVSTSGGYTNITNPGNGTSNPYSNYTAMSVSQSPGESISYAVTVPSSTGVKIWIDLNQDLVFDETELVASHTTYMAAGNWTGTIPIPEELPLGEYRIRIRSGYYWYPEQIYACGVNNGNYGEAEDYTLSVVAPPTCFPPTDLTATNLTSNSADLAWTSDGTAFDIKWGAPGFDVEAEGTLEEDFENGATLSGLAPQTTYQFYVRNNCGVDGLSVWAGPYGFTTLCVPVAVLPYTENFDTYGTGSNAFPDCWERPVTYTSGSVWPSIIGVSGNSSPNSLRFQSAVGTPTYAVSPAFAEDVHNLRVKFNLRKEGPNSGSIDIGVMSDPFDLNSFELIQTINPTETTFIEYTINLNNTTLSGSNNYIAFRHNSNANNWYYWLDDFVVELLPSCIEPSALTATPTHNSAVLGWTSDGEQFDIKWGTPGFDVETEGTLAEDFENGATLSGLSPQTTYQFYVRQICGAEESAWAGPYTFTTLCEAVSVLNENFDSTTTPNLPGCWGKIFDNGASSYATITTTTTNSSSPNGVSLYNSDSSSSSNIILVSPVLSNLDAGTHWLRFSGRNSTASQDIVIGTLSDPTDGSTFTPFETVDLTTTFAEYTVDFSAYSGTDTYIGFRRLSTSTYTYVYLDDIVWEEKPSCMFPLDLTATNLTSNSADLSWTSDGEQFDIKWGAPGFDVETEGTLEEDFANGGTLSGLDSITAYQFYVRNNCGGDLSVWAGPFGFTTLCAPEAAPTTVQYFSDFSADAPNPVCWSEAKGAVTENSVLSGTTSKWAGGNFGNTGSDTAARVNLYSTNPGDWLISQQIDLGSTPGAFRVKYDMAVTAYTGTASQSTLGTHIVRVIVSTDGGATWSVDNTIRTYTGAGSYSNTGQSETINLEAYSGVVKIAFVATTSSTSPDVYFFIDNFLVEEIPSCLEPSGLLATNITYESADLGWTSDGEQFDIKWGEPGFDVETEGTLEEGFANGGTLSGLDSNTAYQFYVRNDCGGDLSAWAGPYTFTTSCIATTVPYLQDFESATVPALPDCTSIQNLGSGNNWVTVSNTSYGFTGKSLRYNYNTSNAANVWFYTQGIELEAGVEYVISYDYGGGSASYTEKMKVAYGTSPAHTAMTTQLADHPNINQGTKQYNEVVFSPVATGVYYFGFHAYSAANMLSFHLDNIRITTKGWTGELSTAWENTANWRGGLPTTTDDVIIKAGSTNYPVISGDVEVASITVEDGASVTVNGSLTTGDITVATGGNFVVSNGASLMQSEAAVNTGIISVHRNSNPMFRLDYTLWSSPVTGQNLQAFSPETLPTRIYKYDAVNDAYDNTYSESTFLAGQGYLFRSPNNWVINDGTNTAQAYAGVFTGVANNADIPVTVVSNSFNGLGNPYPSAIDAEELFAANSTIQTIYFWTNSNAPVEGVYNANNWASWTTTGATSADGSVVPNGEIAVGQGFIAHVNGGTSVTFNNDMRIAGAGMFFRAMQDERHRLWLNLVSNNLTLNQILIGYVSGATQGEDNQIDGEMFGYGESALYSLINNSDKEFVIQGRSLPFETSDVVPLGFRATTAGEFTISLANFDGLFAEGQNIYLKDNVTQIVHNLKEGAYAFISEEGTFDTRFEVVYQTTMSVDTPNLDNNWIVFKQGGQFQIMTQGFDMKSVQVFDMLGRTVYASAAEGTTHSIDRIDANQVLIVKITTADGDVLTKKVQN